MAGLLIVLQEMLIGLAMGFSIRIIFAAVEMAGEISSLTMGLGFATFFDPTTQGRSSAISQFLSLVATMAFLAVNAHLVLLSALVESFHPAGVQHPHLRRRLQAAGRLGRRIFSTGCSCRCPSWRLY
jgi:flagellar biosynthetic protein FliR